MSFIPCINPAVSEQFEITYNTQELRNLNLSQVTKYFGRVFIFLHLSIGMCSLVGAYLCF
jgi:hypothetical protein